MLVLNLKTYLESVGENNFKLLECIRQFIDANPNSKDLIYVAPNMVELASSQMNFPELNIISQNVDYVPQGKTTGWVPAETLVSNNISISLLNHSEHRIDFKTLITAIRDIQAKGINLIVCCESIQEALELLVANPYAIAYESKDLIGSGISITSRPEIVTEFINAVKGKTRALIGAGVSTGEDIIKSINLGANGILLASAFDKAADPYKKLEELTTPFLICK